MLVVASDSAVNVVVGTAACNLSNRDPPRPMGSHVVMPLAQGAPDAPSDACCGIARMELVSVKKPLIHLQALSR